MKRRLSPTERVSLRDALLRSGFIIWAGLVDREYDRDAGERRSAHHLWNSMPVHLRPHGWRKVRET